MPPKIKKHTGGLATPGSSAIPPFDPTNPLIVQGDRSDPGRGRQPAVRRGPRRPRPVRRAGEEPRAHPHLPPLAPVALERRRRRHDRRRRWSRCCSRYSKFPLPPNLPADLAETVGRYGRVRLERIDEDKLRLVCADKPLLEELARQPKLRDYLGERLDAASFAIEPAHRGVLKQALIARRLPGRGPGRLHRGRGAADRRCATWPRSGLPFHVRDYQREAADVFYAGGDVRGGSGVIVLPCGAGKTIVGIAAMALLQKNTLILTTSITAVKQWQREILDKTDLTEDEVTEYTGETKEIGPVTLATYQILTYRPDKTEDFPHFKLFDERDWGLIIYDEVHLLPAPVFRVTAQIQARRRLGLTATLVREDGREGDVFSLIGPKKYDVPWRELETKGWIAAASCTEIRVALPDDRRGWSTPSPSGATSTASPARTRPRTTSSPSCSTATPTSAC